MPSGPTSPVRGSRLPEWSSPSAAAPTPSRRGGSVRGLPPGLRDMRLDRTRGATCRSRIPSIGRRRSGQSGVALTSTTKSMQPASGLSSHLGRRSPDNGRQVRRPDRARTRGGPRPDQGSRQPTQRFEVRLRHRLLLARQSCRSRSCPSPIQPPRLPLVPRAVRNLGRVCVSIAGGAALVYRAPPKQRPTSCPKRLAPAYTL